MMDDLGGCAQGGLWQHDCGRCVSQGECVERHPAEFHALLPQRGNHVRWMPDEGVDVDMNMIQLKTYVSIQS